jgi:O-acetylhomoserine (thiol)-lyase
MKLKMSYKFDTMQVHAGFHGDDETNSVAVPIYQTTAYTFDSAKHAADLFELKTAGNIYTRINNPTTAILEARVAALEGGSGALALSSGQSATTLAVLNICYAGENIVSASSLYGGTHTLFVHTFKKMGIDVKLANPDNPEEIKNAIDEKTKAVFIEIIGNPAGNIPDITAIAEIAHSAGIPLIVDNTFATPYLARPFEFGADIVVHSATKFLGGHGNSMGGLIVESGKFDWSASGKFPCLTESDPSYHGVKYYETFGDCAYITKARVQLLRDIGCTISPMNSFLILNGIETLSLRIKKHVENAVKVAEFLQGHPAVAWVNYPGLPGNKYHGLCKKYLPRGCGSVFSFGLKGGYDACIKTLENVKLFYHVTNLGDVRSVITHPASTTHSQLNAGQQKESGVAPEMIRLSIGIEDAEDIISDLEQTL